jgi:hypothetical protein
MIAATVRAPQPGNEKGRLAGRPSSNFNPRSVDDNNDQPETAQPLSLVPRIIATHWLRPEAADLLSAGAGQAVSA